MKISFEITPIVRLLFDYKPNITLPLIKQLVNQGHDIKASDHFALRTACCTADKECVQYIVELGGDIFIHDEEPIFNAIQYDLEITKYLIEKGANPYTCPDWQLGGYPAASASKGNLPLLKYLIEELKLSHNLDEDSPFIYACRDNQVQSAQYLYDLGVNIETQGNDPFNEACKYNSLDSIYFLIDKGVDITKDIQKIITTIILKENYHILPIIIENLVPQTQLELYLNENCKSYLKFYDMDNKIPHKELHKKKKL